MRTGGSGASTRPGGCADGRDTPDAVRATSGMRGRGILADRLTDQSISPAWRATTACAPPPSSSTRPRTPTATSRPPTASSATPPRDGAELVVLPEKWTVLGTPEQLAAGAEPLDGPSITWARDARARARHRPGRRLDRRARAGPRRSTSNTSVHVGPDGELRAVYRKIHMFDVEVGGIVYRESDSEEPGDEIVVTDARRRRRARA